MSDTFNDDIPLGEDDEAVENDGSDAVDSDNENYLGVDPIYKNSAYDIDSPGSHDDDEIAKRQKANEEDRASRTVGVGGYSPRDVHPSQHAKQKTSPQGTKGK